LELGGEAGGSPRNKSVKSFIIIEDDLSVRYLLKEAVKGLGHELIAAVDNIASAMVYLKAGKVPDIVLLDVVLPGEVGTNLIEYLRTNHKETRIILATGLSEERILRLVAPGGYDAILPKPFMINHLSALIDSFYKSPEANPPSPSPGKDHSQAA